jgi:hypothetical protein
MLMEKPMQIMSLPALRSIAGPTNRVSTAITVALASLATLSCSGTAPGAADASPPSANAARCELPRAYEFTWVGGMTPTRDRFVLEPPDQFSMTRNYSFGQRPEGRCSGTLPACDAPDPDRVTVASLTEHLTNPLVAQTWPDSGERLVGRDLRPVDGVVLTVSRSGGGTLMIGTDCGNASNCTAIPPEIGALANVLRDLAGQISSASECSALAM